MSGRGKVLRIHSTVAVTRALSQIIVLPVPPRGAPADAGNRPINYRNDDSGLLGGRDPEAPHCADWSFGDRVPTSDCIGLTLWSSGIDRYQPGFHGTHGAWLNCKSLMADARTTQKVCRPLRFGEVEQPGDWLLTEAHIGVIVRPTSKGSKMLIVDCSPRHGRETAVNIGGPWSKACQVIRPLVYS